MKANGFRGAQALREVNLLEAVVDIGKDKITCTLLKRKVHVPKVLRNILSDTTET